jgi:predicted alpha/beta-hydrolase family hydrolase
MIENMERQMELIDRDGVKGSLERPGVVSENALVLTHGAGSNSNAAILKAVSGRLCERGWIVLRCDLPFRQKHAGPPRPNEAAADREGLQQALGVLRSEAGPSVRLFLGGHSYGGRQATMLAADDPAIDAVGLFLMSYPLHPPGKPAQMRTTHLPSLRLPAFFAHGIRDDFGKREEMEQALKMIPAPTQLFMVEGAGHDLGGGKKLGFLDEFLNFSAGL